MTRTIDTHTNQEATMTYQDFDTYEEYLDYLVEEAELAELSEENDAAAERRR